jgi:glycosyltransferase involved in cell wall biosynthesis
MRVLLLYHGCIEGIGGAQRAVWNIATAYHMQGIEVVLLCSCRKLRMTKMNRGFILLSVPSHGIRGVALIPSIKTFKLIVQLIKASDIVHLLFSETLFQLTVALMSRILGKAVISSHLAFISYTFHHNPLIRVLSPLITLFKILIAYLSDIVHTPLFHEVSIIRKLPLLRTKVVCIPHGIPLDTSLVKPESKNVGHGNKLKLMFLGRFTEDKGALVLLDAISILVEKNIPIELLIVGPRSIALRTMYKFAKRNPYKFIGIKNNIKLIGEVDEYTKYSLITKVHCGIIPSLSDAVEAYSIALSEFNALGRYVIASRVGALKYRLYANIDAGLTVEPRNPRALANAIEWLWDLFIRRGKTINVPKLFDVITITEEIEKWRQVVSYIKLRILQRIREDIVC